MTFSVALISAFNTNLPLERRKGGGGGGKGGGKGGSKGGSSGSVGKSTTSSTHTSSSKTISTPHLLGGQSSAVTYSSGGGKASTLTSGAFNGRTVGGGSRSQIYGTSVYGSGYPTRPFGSSGVAGLPFPYYYYPVVWEKHATASSYPSYLNATREYGSPSNNSRPGGVLMQATLHSNTTGSTFHFLGDNSTAFALLPIIRANCSVHGNLDNATSSSVPLAYAGDTSSAPHAVDAVQYYRASSAVLTLEGYNNTAVLSSTPNATASPLPADVDHALLTCLNATIGAAIPLVDASAKFHLHLSVTDYIFFGIAGIIGLILLVILSLHSIVKFLGWKQGRFKKKSLKRTFGDFRELFQGKHSGKGAHYHGVANPATQDVHVQPFMKEDPFPTAMPIPQSFPSQPFVTGRHGTLEYQFDLSRNSPSIA